MPDPTISNLMTDLTSTAIPSLALQYSLPLVDHGDEEFFYVLQHLSLFFFIKDCATQVDNHGVIVVCWSVSRFPQTNASGDRGVLSQDTNPANPGNSVNYRRVAGPLPSLLYSSVAHA